MKPINGWVFVDADGEIIADGNVIVHTKKDKAFFASVTKLQAYVGKDYCGPVAVSRANAKPGLRRIARLPFCRITQSNGMERPFEQPLGL